ncbi:hypothetical protein MAJ_11067, partial [Metarhizium majus ARSEF 297]
MPLTGSLQAKSIYISLNTRPQAGEYHWGLILTDSHKNPVLYHATNRNGPWTFEARKAKPDQSMSLIVLILVDKVKSHSRTKEIIESIPADGSPSQRTGEFFTCRIWIKDVLIALHDYGEITLPTDIDSLETLAVRHGLRYAPYAEGGYGATVVNDAFRSG